MRCRALVGEKALKIRHAQDRTRQCQRSAKVDGLCRQHAVMPEIYCGAHRSRLLRRAHRFYCSKCGSRFRPVID